MKNRKFTIAMFAFVLTGCSEVGQILEQSVSEALGVPSGSFNERKTGTASALDRTSSQNTRFSGSYSGEAMEDTGLFLELLEIRQSANEYNLTLYQNAQNFEEGMSRPSNTKFTCLLYTSPSPRDQRGSRMPSSA